jgi:cbb3-type cytochrome oxidase subunit 3
MTNGRGWLLVVLYGLAVLVTVAEGAPFVAPPAPQQPGANYNWLIMLVLVFGVFYFLVWRPRKRERQRQQEKQLLGGDEMSVSVKRNEPTKRATNRSYWFWPSMQTLQSAHKATRTAFWFALVVAVATAIFSILAIGGVQTSILSSPWSLVDAALFGAIAIGLYRYSRVAAVAGLVLYVLNQVWKYMLSEEAFPTHWWVMSLAFTLVFLGGVRGAFSYHRLKRAAAQEQGNESKDTAKGDL